MVVCSCICPSPPISRAARTLRRRGWIDAGLLGPTAVGRDGCAASCQNIGMGRIRMRMSNKLWGGRFTGATDPLMEQFNASIGFDKRLWQADMRAARPMRGAGARGHPDRGRGRGTCDWAGAGGRGVGTRRICDPARRRGHSHGQRTAPDRTGGDGGRQAAHRAQPQRPDRHRHAPLAARGDRDIAAAIWRS